MTTTPRPWFVSRDGTRILCGDPDDPEVVVECESNDIMTVNHGGVDDAPGNAALIVRAVNAHEELVAIESRVAAFALGGIDDALILDARALLARLDGKG